MQEGMKSGTIKVGWVYWVAGQGPMRLTEAPDPPRKTTYTLSTVEGYTYHAGEGQLIKIMERKDVEEHLARLRERQIKLDEEAVAEFLNQMEE